MLWTIAHEVKQQQIRRYRCEDYVYQLEFFDRPSFCELRFSALIGAFMLAAKCQEYNLYRVLLMKW